MIKPCLLDSAPAIAPRTEKEMSQEEYAFEAGIHRTYVSDIERGARNPTATVIEKLAKPLGIAPGRLLD